MATRNAKRGGNGRATGRAGGGRAKERGQEPVRFAVIGMGHFAQGAVLPGFKTARGCELAAIFSEDPTKRRTLARKYGVAAALPYDQYDEYLRGDQVDAVYIALPNDLHCEYAVRAAEAGVHVLTEKPMALDSGEATRMIEACAEAEVKLMVAYRLHFEAATLEAIERLRRGELGNPRYFTSTFGMQIRPGNIRTERKRGGGPLLDLGVYCINAARYLFRSEPTEAVAFAESNPKDRRFQEIDEQVTAILRFPEQRTAQFTVSFGSHSHSTLSVIGDKGRLTLEPAYEYAEGLALSLEVGERAPKHKKFPTRDQISAELMAFADCIRTGRDPEPSGEEGLADLRVIEAITRSIETGTAEKIETVPRRQRPSARQRIDRPAHGMPEVVHAASAGQ
jgi:predicted dehydrogenase